MKILLVLAMVMTIVHGRPQYQVDSPGFGNNQARGSPSSLRVNCRSEENPRGSGRYQFNCAGVDPRAITRSSEHILWLKSGSNQAQSLDVVVPNYRLEELIRAALKAGTAGGATAVNILLKKPETVYDVQAQDGVDSAAIVPQVSLEYEQLPPPTSQHYPTDKKYSPLTAPIREP